MDAFSPGDEEAILEACKVAMIHTHKLIADAVYHNPERAFREVHVPGKGLGHVTTRIDLDAQHHAERMIRKAGLSLCEEGEETVEARRVRLATEKRPVVVMDMIDGTDLFTKEMGNWCSAMFVYYPPTEEILGAVIGLPLGDRLKVYMAARSFEGARLLTYDIVATRAENHYLLPQEQKRVPPRLTPQRYVRDPQKPLDGTAICFYGQKRSRLLHLRDKTSFPWSEQLANSRKARIYTLAGNPMIAKLAEGKVSAVFEPLGQHPHDSVPGLFIAQKAGAYLARPDGSPLELGRAIKKREDITYIAACNEALFKDLAGLLRKPTRAR